MPRLAELTGYTVGSASVTLGKIRRKMKLHAEGASAPSTPKKPAGVSKSTPKGTPKGTPKSSPKKRTVPDSTSGSPKKKKGKQVDNDDDYEEFHTPHIKAEEHKDLLRDAGEFLVKNEYASGQHGFNQSYAEYEGQDDEHI